jgi:hypothetical protein
MKKHHGIGLSGVRARCGFFNDAMVLEDAGTALRRERTVLGPERRSEKTGTTSSRPRQELNLLTSTSGTALIR